MLHCSATAVTEASCGAVLQRTDLWSAGFAMMEAMLVLAAGLQKYEFITDASALFPEATPRITLRPAAVQIVLRPREFDSSI